MTQGVYHQIADVLLELEMQMRAQGLWSKERPSAERLASVEPFCIDTLNFTEWLQFIFLPRMSLLVEAGADLPPVSQIAPLAEEYFKSIAADGARICQLLEQFDLIVAIYAEPD